MPHSRVTTVKPRSQPALRREHEGGDQEDHVEPAVGDAEVLGDRATRRPAALAAGAVHEVRVQRHADEDQHDQQDADDRWPSPGSGSGRPLTRSEPTVPGPRSGWLRLGACSTRPPRGRRRARSATR